MKLTFYTASTLIGSILFITCASSSHSTPTPFPSEQVRPAGYRKQKSAPKTGTP